MPFVEIKLWPGRSAERKRKLIQEVSKCVSEQLDVTIEHVQVVLTEISKDDWGLCGEQASQLRKYYNKP